VRRIRSADFSDKRGFGGEKGQDPDQSKPGNEDSNAPWNPQNHITVQKSSGWISELRVARDKLRVFKGKPELDTHDENCTAGR